MAHKVKFLQFVFRRKLACDQRLESLSQVSADWLANKYGRGFWADRPHTKIYARIPNFRVCRLTVFNAKYCKLILSKKLIFRIFVKNLILKL